MAGCSADQHKHPLYTLLKEYWKPLLVGMGIYMTVTTPFYTLTVFVETFMQKLGYSSTYATQISFNKYKSFQLEI